LALPFLYPPHRIDTRHSFQYSQRTKGKTSIKFQRFSITNSTGLPTKFPILTFNFFGDIIFFCPPVRLNNFFRLWVIMEEKKISLQKTRKEEIKETKT